MAYDSKILFEKLYMMPNLKKNLGGYFFVRKAELIDIIDNLSTAILNDTMVAKKNGVNTDLLKNDGIFGALNLLEDSIEKLPQFFNLAICPSKQYLDLIKITYEKLPEAFKQ